MRVACIQPEIFQSRNNCYFEVEELIKRLLEDANNCDIICLPERWVPVYTNSAKNFQKEKGDDYLFIKNLANEYHINILSGGIWEKRDNLKKPHITCYFFNERGEEVDRQDKIHLYSYEREQFEPGNVLKLFKLNTYHFAILICFDMAFFETPRLAAENGADLLLSPTQIRLEGMDNWDTYLKARSLENRIPIAACNTFGTFFRRKFIGKSKIISFIEGNISPSKLKIVEAPSNLNGYIFDDIDLDFPKKLRKIRFKEKIEKSKIEVKNVNS
ncbi:MAG: carbon-nitrogen hydrolase family protein [Candidatus Hodarchaeota archaeon]